MTTPHPIDPSPTYDSWKDYAKTALVGAAIVTLIMAPPLILTHAPDPYPAILATVMVAAFVIFMVLFFGHMFRVALGI